MSEPATMEMPQIRAGKVTARETPIRVVAFFYNSAPGNSVIQHLAALGIPGDAMGVTPPERIASGQGMVLSIACADEAMAAQIEQLCRAQGAEIHRQRQ
jgi:hypothetical protein